MPGGTRRGAPVLPHQGIYDAARKQFGPLGIGPRAAKALVAGGIFTIADLNALAQSDLERLPGIGALTVRQLRPYLRRENLPDAEHAALLSVKFAQDVLLEIDRWALAQKDPVSRAEAIRRLVKAGLSRSKG